MIDAANQLLKLSKWGGECSLDLDYKRDEHPSILESKAYKKSEDLFAADIILKVKPAVNRWEYKIKSKGLRFTLQPELTQEEKDLGCIRPTEIVGSIAIYHESRKHNKYGTGKFGDIHKPKIIDATGDWVYGGLEVDGYIDPKTLTVTAPWHFLDRAVYPVTVDPDFGYTAIGGANRIIADNYGPPHNRRAGASWTMPEDGTVNYLRAYLVGELGSGAVDIKAVINQDDSGGGGIHGEIAGPVENAGCAEAAHWEEFTFAGEGLTNAVNYLLNLVGDGSTVAAGKEYNVKYDANGAIDSYYKSTGANYAAPTDPWVQAAEGTTLDYSIFVNYTALGWSGEIAGVTNPAKIAGVAKADIASVKGVA